MTRSPRKTAKKRKRKKSHARSTPAIAELLATPMIAPPPFIVDAHCHTFNASDLSKVGFVTEVLLDSDETLIKKLFEPFVVLLVKLIAHAPGYQDELDHLDILRQTESRRSSAAQLQAHADERGAIDQQLWQDVSSELSRISVSSNGQERALFQAIVDEVHPGGMQAFVVDIESTEVLAQRIALSGGPFSRYIKWVGRLKHFRADIVAEIVQTYGAEPNGVRLFASALVDFEFWVKDEPRTKFPHQIDLGARLARAFPGRIHFLAPFDPWRDIDHDSGQESSLDLVKKAVNEDGFIGVKVYPPMGFAASGNSKLDFRAVGVKDSPAFGARLDATLEQFFAWAVAEDVPIMAHCNLSQESKHGFARRASPAFWADALSKHRGLRLNLGHFGGQDNLGGAGGNDAADWPEAIIALMGTPEGTRLYTDIGNFKMRGTSWFRTLKKALQDNPVLLSRLMYGSDWMMLATSDRYEEFFDLFRKGLASMNMLTDAQVAAILGGNARNFFGLNPGEKPRARLETFYRTNDIPRPPWLE